MNIRQRINTIIEPRIDNIYSRIYDWFMLIVIL